MKPTVGRMVYYKARGSADGVFPKVDRAAIVTDVREVDHPENGDGVGGGAFECRLSIHNPDGLMFSGWLSQGQEGGQWDWMPFQKDQQLRYTQVGAGGPDSRPDSENK